MIKTDGELLEALLACEDKLSGYEQKAFSAMHDDIESGKWASLTAKQRAWAIEVAGRLELPGFDSVAAAENLVSSGKVKPTVAERENLQKFLSSLPKAPFPPHMRCRSNPACQKKRGHDGACWPVANLEPKR